MRYFVSSGKEKRCGMSFLSHAVITTPGGHTPEPEGHFQSVLDHPQPTTTTRGVSAGGRSEFSPEAGEWKTMVPHFYPLGSFGLSFKLPLQAFPNLSTLVQLLFRLVFVQFSTHLGLTSFYSYTTLTRLFLQA